MSKVTKQDILRFKSDGVFHHGTIKHGAETAAVLYGCDCKICSDYLIEKRKVNNAYNKNRNAEYREYFKLTGELPPSLKHGAIASQIGCRCKICIKYAIVNVNSHKERQNVYKEYYKLNNQLPSNVKHGVNGYAIGCRCEICTKLVRDKNKKIVLEQRAYFKLHGVFKSDKVIHGSHYSYKIGCRCEICKNFINDQKKRKKENKHV